MFKYWLWYKMHFLTCLMFTMVGFTVLYKIKCHNDVKFGELFSFPNGYTRMGWKLIDKLV